MMVDLAAGARFIHGGRSALAVAHTERLRIARRPPSRNWDAALSRPLTSAWSYPARHPKIIDALNAKVIEALNEPKTHATLVGSRSARQFTR